MSNPKSKNYQIVKGKRGLINPDSIKHTRHTFFNGKTVVLETTAKEPISLKKRTFSQSAKVYNQVVQLGGGKVRTIKHKHNK